MRGDREVMFEVVMTVVNYPGAEVNWCEWWIENMQRQDVHRRREFVQRLAELLFKRRCPVGKNEIRHAFEVNGVLCKQCQLVCDCNRSDP